MPDKDQNLNELKHEYEILRKKYSLPEFNKLNEEFEIERLADKKSDFILRGIRRSILNKSVNFLKFLEEFVNPSMASFASLVIQKSFADKERELVKRCYENLVALELKAAHLEIEYNEKGEVEFIKSTVKDWDDIKSDFKELAKTAEKIWKGKIEEEGIVEYFG
ncbi:MAG: hypothetical protein AABX59_03685 [Nanoarchaeota archaeon]